MFKESVLTKIYKETLEIQYIAKNQYTSDPAITDLQDSVEKLCGIIRDIIEFVGEEKDE